MDVPQFDLTLYYREKRLLIILEGPVDLGLLLSLVVVADVVGIHLKINFQL